MDEYISCESICRSCFHSYVCQQFNEHRDDYNEKCHYFNNHFVPAADVRPVVRGEWRPITQKMAARGREPEDIITEYQCSICGRTERDMQPFCNCGAMMGGNNEAD